jgi:hypothetical protein
MSYLPLQSLRSPQRDIDNAPPKTFVQGYNNVFQDSFKAPSMPNVYTTVPRAIQTANQNYIGRHMLMPETQNYDRAYQPTLENLSIPLDEVPLRNVGGIQRPMFSVY